MPPIEQMVLMLTSRFLKMFTPAHNEKLISRLVLVHCHHHRKGLPETQSEHHAWLCQALVRKITSCLACTAQANLFGADRVMLSHD